LPFYFPIIYHGNAIKKRKKCNKGYGNRKQKYSVIVKPADKRFRHSKEPGKGLFHTNNPFPGSMYRSSSYSSKENGNTRIRAGRMQPGFQHLKPRQVHDRHVKGFYPGSSQ
jgi:hypothetical protein